MVRRGRGEEIEEKNGEAKRRGEGEKKKRRGGRRDKAFATMSIQ